MRSFELRRWRASLSGLALCSLVLLTGCERKEKVLEIKGPGIDVEVNKDSKGNREIEVESKGKDTIEIDTNRD